MTRFFVNEQETIESIVDSLECLAYLKDLVDELYLLRQELKIIKECLSNIDIVVEKENENGN